MIRVCICDDEKQFCKEFAEKLVAYSISKNIDIKYFVINDIDSLLNCAEVYDVLFLDIRFNQIDQGVNAAIQLREKKNRALIVFLTSLDKYSKEGYKANAFRYLTKPINDVDFNETMTAICKTMEMDEQDNIRIPFTITGNGKCYLYAEEIISIRSLPSSRTRQITTINEVLQTRESLVEIIERLPKHLFAFSHQSAIVNFRYIKKTDKSVIYLSNGDTIPIGRKYRKECLEGFNKYLGGRFIDNNNT